MPHAPPDSTASPPDHEDGDLDEGEGARVDATSTADRPVQVVLDPRRVLVALLVVIVGLQLANVAGVVLRRRGHTAWDLVALTDVNNELSIPTWFSALLLAGGAVLMLVVALDPPPRTTPRRWRFLAVVLAVMSADEVASYHETWVEPVRDGLSPTGFLLQAWVIPGAVLVTLVAVSQVRFLGVLPATLARGLVLATAVFLAGALGMEMVGARYGEEWGTDTRRYDAMVAMEEGLEMAGAALVVVVLLAHLGRRRTRLVARVTPPRA